MSQNKGWRWGVSYTGPEKETEDAGKQVHTWLRTPRLQEFTPQQTGMPTKVAVWVLSQKWGFPGGAAGKESSAGDARDVSSIPGLGRSPRVGNGNPLQYSCPENSMDKGAWQGLQSRGPQRAGHHCAHTGCLAGGSQQAKKWRWKESQCIEVEPSDRKVKPAIDGLNATFLLRQRCDPGQRHLIPCQQLAPPWPNAEVEQGGLCPSSDHSHTRPSPQRGFSPQRLLSYPCQVLPSEPSKTLRRQWQLRESLCIVYGAQSRRNLWAQTSKHQPNKAGKMAGLQAAASVGEVCSEGPGRFQWAGLPHFQQQQEEKCWKLIMKHKMDVSLSSETIFLGQT